MKSSFARQAWYIGLFDALPLLRDPMFLILLSLFSFFPVLFLYLFVGTEAALPAVVGAIILTLGLNGLASAQAVYFNKHWFRFQDMFVASPVSPFSYAIGLSLSTLLMSAPAVILAFGVLLAAKPAGAVAVLGTLGVSALLWISMVFTGFAIGASTKNTRRANSIPQVLGFLLGFLPPVYYPLELLPEYVRPVAMMIPSTHAAQLAKHYFGLLTISDFEIVFGWAFLAAFALAMVLLVVRKARWVDP